jgi:hypothetical protein
MAKQPQRQTLETVRSGALQEQTRSKNRCVFPEKGLNPPPRAKKRKRREEVPGFEPFHHLPTLMYVQA